MTHRYNKPMLPAEKCPYCKSTEIIELDRVHSINYGNSQLFLSVNYRCDECAETFMNNEYFWIVPVDEWSKNNEA